jgi:carbonic anhydrase
VNTQNPFAVIFGCADSRLAAKEAVETGEAPQGHIRDLAERITPSVLKSLREDKTDVDDMVIEHVKQTVRRLLDSSRMIFDAVDNYSAVVVGVSYRLEEGQAQLVSKSGVL